MSFEIHLFLNNAYSMVNSKSPEVLIQDWTDFDKSLLHNISREYYAKKGIDAFDNSKLNESIPNSVSCSYPHALSVAKILLANLSHYPSNKKVKVLELGSGSGMFARHFLLAAAELGFLERLEFYLSDIAAHSLLQIKEKGILNEFTEGINYHLLMVQLPDLDSVTDVYGNSFELKELDLVIANYVIDALPMMPLKRNKNGKFDKLQLRLADKRSFEEVNLVHDTSFLSSLDIKEKWVEYNLEEVSNLERKYYPIFEINSRKYPSGTALRYNYFALAVIDSLKTKLVKKGFFYILDIPSKTGISTSTYLVYANSIANLIDEQLLIEFTRSENLHTLNHQDHIFFRLLVCNSSEVNHPLVQAFTQEFHTTNHTNLYHELTQMLNMIRSPQSIDVLKFLIDKFQEIDGKSALSITSKGFYHEAIRDYAKAIEYYQIAQTVDFFNECLLEEKLIKLTRMLKPVQQYQIV